MHYSNGRASVNRGGQTDNQANIVLEPGEFITSIEGIVDYQIIAQLTFHTNKGIVTQIRRQMTASTYDTSSRGKIWALRARKRGHHGVICMEGNQQGFCRLGATYGITVF